ncbi:MAG: toxin-antitoxin system HicB family antitoxin [Chloroflexi bacterium]|nr:toxin-antitoxin system HicB family antitoxin [Chloroflexota bacterium]
MTLKNDRYTYRVTWSEEDGEYVGLCAEFPSLSWLASTPEAAFRGIRKVVADVAADMRTNGEPMPEPLATRQGIGLDTYTKTEELIRIGKRAVRRAQQESREKGVPNVYSINGIIYYELPTGELSRVDPYEAARK